MFLKPLECIPSDQIESLPLSHAWSDWDPYEVVGVQDPTTEAKLSALSDRAILSYSIGCAEWVLCRFRKHLDDPRPYAFVEASWAYEMSDVVAAPPQSKEEEWKGPVRGPIDLSLMTVLNTIYSTEDGTAQVDGAFAELIPLLVIEPQDLFLEWKAAVFERFKERYPRSAGELGKSVPREILDVSRVVLPEEEPALVRDLLSKALADQNPFIRLLKQEQS